MQIGLNNRFKFNNMIKVIIALIILLAASLCVRGFFYGFNTPLQVIVSIKTWIELSFAKMFHTTTWLNRDDILASLPYYGSVIYRVKLTAMTFACGMLMALSGSIFQTVFRNPMAAPTMLGVSSGVNVGVLILVLQFGNTAYSMLLQKYIYCYIGAAVMLAIVLIVGKLSSGKKRMAVFDLLIVGAILSQIVGAVITYYTYAMENDQILVYQEILGALQMDVSARAFAFLAAALLIGIVPMFLLRFSFNAVSFEHDDTRSLGVNSYGMKIITMVLGTIMITGAMIHCGSAGMISLIAPFISRGIFGAEFRKVFWGNLFIGGGILVLCKDIVGLIPFGDKGLPLGTIVDFVAMPIFVIIVLAQRRIWE